ncbi:MAG TPA: DsbA family oxidoreductase [Actinomycetota bacterium]|nr:DsbA family oxidoreductase [Actinomycetota bacterium]
MRVEYWADVVCPWCYIGLANLDRALAEYPADVAVVVRSFQLDPAAPLTPRPSVDHLVERYGSSRAQVLAMMQQVASVAAGAGLVCQLEKSRVGSTLDAHRLLHLAAAQGVQLDLARRLFVAHFAEGRSLFDTDSLVDLGVGSGLDHDQVRAVLDSDRFAEDVARDMAQAQSYGITAVPFYVIDGSFGVSGAQPVDRLLSALTQAGEHGR